MDKPLTKTSLLGETDVLFLLHLRQSLHQLFSVAFPAWTEKAHGSQPTSIFSTSSADFLSSAYVQPVVTTRILGKERQADEAAITCPALARLAFLALGAADFLAPESFFIQLIADFP